MGEGRELLAPGEIRKIQNTNRETDHCGTGHRRCRQEKEAEINLEDMGGVRWTGRTGNKGELGNETWRAGMY